jgi:hypothetical protein
VAAITSLVPQANKLGRACMHMRRAVSAGVARGADRSIPCTIHRRKSHGATVSAHDRGKRPRLPSRAQSKTS